MCFDYLDAPPVVIGARNWITPPHEFDKYFFPYAEWIIDAVNARLIPLEGYTSTTTPGRGRDHPPQQAGRVMKPIPAQRKSLRGDSEKKALTNPRFIAIIFMFSGL